MTIRRAGETDGELAERFLQELDDNMLYCRGTGRHRYPVILPPKRGKPLRTPKGFDFAPSEEHHGCFELRETCEICGRVCVSLTEPGGFRARRRILRYEDPAGYAAPKGTGKYVRNPAAGTELDRRLIEGGLFGMPGA